MLNFFENAVNGEIDQLPNDMYRDMEQAFLNEQWDNTSAKTPENGGSLQEQSAFGSSTYNCVQAWISAVVSDVTSGAKDSGDFLKLSFRDINHETYRGLYYKYDNNYWIVHNYNHFDGLAQACGIRRCNNFLRIVDPLNGSVFSVPCVIDYDMASPSTQISKYIITPNNHATVMVQGNTDTFRLLKLNTRYMLGGRPFKLYSFQNTLMDDYTTPAATLLTLDLYLDEEHDKDDKENQLAYNGDYTYVLAINASDMSLAKGTTGTLTANVTLNGTSVNRTVVWSSDNSAVTIDSDGNYSVVGNVGAVANITATLDGNTQVKDTVKITVADEEVATPTIVITPMFDKVRQYQSVTFTVSAEYKGAKYAPTSSSVSVPLAQQDYISVVKQNNQYVITGIKPYSSAIPIAISVTNSSPAFEAEETTLVKSVSMMG